MKHDYCQRATDGYGAYSNGSKLDVRCPVFMTNPTKSAVIVITPNHHSQPIGDDHKNKIVLLHGLVMRLVLRGGSALRRVSMSGLLGRGKGENTIIVIESAVLHGPVLLAPADAGNVHKHVEKTMLLLVPPSGACRM